MRERGVNLQGVTIPDGATFNVGAMWSVNLQTSQSRGASFVSGARSRRPAGVGRRDVWEAGLDRITDGNMTIGHGLILNPLSMCQWIMGVFASLGDVTNLGPSPCRSR